MTMDLGIATEAPVDLTTSTNDAIIAKNELHDSNLDLFYFIINSIVDGVICSLGFVGNALILCVLQNGGAKTSNSIFLQILAISDSCYLVYGVLYLVLPSIHKQTGFLKVIDDHKNYIVTAVMPMAWTALTASTWLVMTIAVDRYAVVAYPLKASRWCTPKKAMWVGGAILILATLFNLVRWPRYYFVSFHSSVQTNATYLSHLKDDIPGWNKDLYRDVYHIGLTYVFIFLVPMIIISVMNLLLIRELHKSSRRRWHLASTASSLKKLREEQSRNNVTHMLVIVITLFLVCQLSDFVSAVVSSGDFHVNQKLLSYYQGIKEALLLLGCSCNFYIYALFYKRFRFSLAKLCGCRRSDSSQEATMTLGTQSTVFSVQTSKA
jgi:hypothetical protein